NIVVPSALADPVGILDNLHRAVAKEYSRRKWVQVRCQWERAQFLANLEAASQAHSPYQAIAPLAFAVVALVGALAIAQLKPPTHRRCLVLMRDLLYPRQRL